MSNSDVEDGFNQVDLVLIDPNLRDYDGEQNRVKVFNFEIETYAWQSRIDTVFWTESIMLLGRMISFLNRFVNSWIKLHQKHVWGTDEFSDWLLRIYPFAEYLHDTHF